MKFMLWYVVYVFILVTMYGLVSVGDPWAVGWMILLLIQPFVLRRTAP